MNFEFIIKTLEPELLQVNQRLQRALSSEVSLIEDVGDYIISSGGKRIRPLLVLLSARALGLSGPAPILTANIIELIHTATLLHDDVVDGSTLRRGKPCANISFGNAASVLTGDFLYSRSFELMCELNNLQVMKVLAEASNKIAEGEVHQLQNRHNPEITQETYFQIIYAKTAKLFEAACHVPAVLAQADSTMTEALIHYGKHLGTAFQIMDDLIDYETSSSESGKNMGDDLAEGKTTLPLIIAMERASPKEKLMIQTAIKKGSLENLEALISILKITDALNFSRELAQQEAEKAKKAVDLLTSISTQENLEPMRALCDIAYTRRT